MLNYINQNVSTLLKKHAPLFKLVMPLCVSAVRLVSTCGSWLARGWRDRRASVPRATGRAEWRSSTTRVAVLSSTAPPDVRSASLVREATTVTCRVLSTARSCQATRPICLRASLSPTSTTTPSRSAIDNAARNAWKTYAFKYKLLPAMFLTM